MSQLTQLLKTWQNHYLTGTTAILLLLVMGSSFGTRVQWPMMSVIGPPPPVRFGGMVSVNAGTVEAGVPIWPQKYVMPI